MNNNKKIDDEHGKQICTKILYTHTNCNFKHTVRIGRCDPIGIYKKIIIHELSISLSIAAAISSSTEPIDSSKSL